MTSKGEKLFFERRFKEAIPALTKKSNKRKDDRFSIGEIEILGVAYLCNWECKKAALHFETIISELPRTSDSHYFFGGFSHWYAKNYSKAIELWKLGFKCTYSGSKLLACRLALYFASLTNPTTFSLDEAKHLLQERIRVIINKDDWPIPIASFLLGNISAERLLELATAKRGKVLEVWIHRQLVQSQFYIGLSQMQCGNATAFTKAQNEYLKSDFDYMGQEEFMLSHMELTK